MDKESIFRLGLDYIKNIDYDNSIEVYNPTNHNHIIYLKLLKDETIICPVCGQVNNAKLRSTENQVIKHASVVEDNLIIILKRRKYKCDCGAYFKQENPFTSNKSKCSLEKKIKVLNDLKATTATFSSLADKHQLSVTTVANIFDKHVDIPRGDLSEVICVDEVYSKHCSYHGYCFVIYSPLEDKIIDILPSRNKADVVAYFSRIPVEERKRVKFFSMDLYKTYKEVQELCFPWSKRAADSFHVIFNISKFFNSARIRIMKGYAELEHKKGNWYWLYKRNWKLLLKNPETLSYKKQQMGKSHLWLSQHEMVDYMLTLDSTLKEAYDLLCEYKSFNSVATSANAKDMFDDLLIKFHNSSLPEFQDAYELLKRWRTEILNSFYCVDNMRISNGKIERVNRDIKTIIRSSFGFKNFQRFRNRVLFVVNKDTSYKL